MITEDVRRLMKQAISSSYDTNVNDINPWRNGTFVKVRRHGLNEVELGVIVGRPNIALPDYSRGYYVRTATTSNPNHYYWKSYGAGGRNYLFAKFCPTGELELTSLDEYMGNGPAKSDILASGTIVSITNPKGHFGGCETRSIITGYCAEHHAYWAWVKNAGQQSCLGVLLNENGSLLVSPLKSDSVPYVSEIHSRPLPNTQQYTIIDDILRLTKNETKYKNEWLWLKDFYEFLQKTTKSEGANFPSRSRSESKPEPKVVIIYRGKVYH
jgi:hypothetical protein